MLTGTDTYAPDVNGASYAAQRLVAGLAGRGHEMHVVAPAHPARPARDRASDDVTEHRARSVPVPRPRGFRVCPPPGLRRRARDLVDRVEPDVVHVHSHLLLGRALVAAAAARGVPVVATTHTLPENLLPALPARSLLPSAMLAQAFWADAARVLARVDVVTAPTAHAARIAERHGVPGPIAVVSNGTDTGRFRPDTDGRGARFRARHGLGDGPLIGYVGRLDAEKHLDELVRALGPAARRFGATAVVVGDGAEAGRLRSVARAQGLADRVVLTGRVDDGELRDAYAALDVFVHPGRAELQSLVTLEAMATALPVVAADAGALPHLVRPGRTGWRYPPGDVDALSRALESLLARPDQARRMGAAGRRLAREHGLAASIGAFDALYHRLVPAASGPVTRRSIA